MQMVWLERYSSVHPSNSSNPPVSSLLLFTISAFDLLVVSALPYIVTRAWDDSFPSISSRRLTLDGRPDTGHYIPDEIRFGTLCVRPSA